MMDMEGSSCSTASNQLADMDGPSNFIASNQLLFDTLEHFIHEHQQASLLQELVTLNAAPLHGAAMSGQVQAPQLASAVMTEQGQTAQLALAAVSGQ